jgi:hypothetical protein
VTPLTIAALVMAGILGIALVISLASRGDDRPSAESSTSETSTDHEDEASAEPTPTPTPSPAPEEDLMYNDVVRYLNNHGYPELTNDDEFDWDIDASCAAIDGTKPGARRMRNDRQAWLDAGWDNEFVDTLFAGCYAKGWAERWVKPQPKTSFGEGTWLVGDDIQPGTYRAGNVDACYWERLSGLSGSFNDIIANDNVMTGQAVVTISPSDRAFNSARCGTWKRIG